jgi:hypothetical protein
MKTIVEAVWELPARYHIQSSLWKWTHIILAINEIFLSFSESARLIS